MIHSRLKPATTTSVAVDAADAVGGRRMRKNEKGSKKILHVYIYLYLCVCVFFGFFSSNTGRNGFNRLQLAC